MGCCSQEVDRMAVSSGRRALNNKQENLNFISLVSMLCFSKYHLVAYFLFLPRLVVYTG